MSQPLSMPGDLTQSCILSDPVWWPTLAFVTGELGKVEAGDRAGQGEEATSGIPQPEVCPGLAVSLGLCRAHAHSLQRHLRLLHRGTEAPRLRASAEEPGRGSRQEGPS